jgi:lysophospholipase L1-like esterase
MFTSRSIAVKCLAVLATAAAVSAAVPPAGAQTPTVTASSSGGYLALGDSIAFGYNPLLDPSNGPSQYVGYPDLVAKSLGLAETNASCPGEATGGFIHRNSPDDNGCETTWRALYRLHVNYASSQLTYAVRYLRNHPHTRLVTLNVGANDVFHCQSVTSDQCASEFPTTLQTISRNLQTIYSAIRSVYSGRLVALTYYSTNYDEPAATALSQALNHVIAARTAAAGGAVADGYAAFGAIASHFQGNPCTAGLLIKKPDGTCDVHPTALGRTVLALAVDVAVLHPAPAAGGAGR